MTARIFKPTKPATQSGLAKTSGWVLTFDSNEPEVIDPLMGWTGSSNTLSQVRLAFASRDEAEDYAKRENLTYIVEEPKETKRQIVSYTDNFHFDRRVPWTH